MFEQLLVSFKYPNILFLEMIFFSSPLKNREFKKKETSFREASYPKRNEKGNIFPLEGL